MAVEQQIGLSLVVIEKLEFCLLVFISGVSMYVLASKLLNQVVDKLRVASLISAVFYIANPYSITVVWPRLTGIYTYSLAPLFVVVLLAGLNSTRSSFYFASVNALVWILFSAGLTNPGFWIPLWLVLFSFFLFYSFKQFLKKDWQNLVRGARLFFMFMSVWLLVNLYWILPLLPSLSPTYESATASGAFEEVLLWKSAYTTVINVVRLMASWTLYSSYGSGPYFSWAQLYMTAPFIAISVLLPVLVFFPLLTERKGRIHFLSLLAVVGIFLAKGAADPLGSTYLFAFERVPFSGLFRDSFEKFGVVIVLPYSILLGNGFSAMTSRMNSGPFLKHTRSNCARWLKNSIALALILVLLVLSAFPFYTGELFESGSPQIPSARIKVPEYYSEASRWLNSFDGDYSMFVLPPAIEAQTCAYSWSSGYFGSDPLDEYYFRYRILGYTTGYPLADGVQNHTARLLVSGQAINGTSTVLGFLNARYILIHDDWNTEYARRTQDPFHIKNRLARIPGISSLRSFGNLSLYLVESVASKVYAAQTQIIYVDDDILGGSSDLSVVAPLLPRSIASLPVVFFASQNLRFTSLLLNQSDTLVIYRQLHSVDASGAGCEFRIIEGGLYQIYLYEPSISALDGRHFIAEFGGKLPKVLMRSYRVSDGFYELRMEESLQLASGAYCITLRPADRLHSPFGGYLLLVSTKDRSDLSPLLIVSKVDPTHYKVSCKAARPFFLVLSNTYDPNWSATLEGRRLVTHLIANGYSNCWYVDTLGQFEIDLRFEPDKMRCWGFLVCGTVLSLAVLCATLSTIRDAKRYLFRRLSDKHSGVVIN